MKHHPVGLIVDSIGNIVQCDELDIEQCPANAGNIEEEFIEGVVKLEDELLVILRGTRYWNMDACEHSRPSSRRKKMPRFMMMIW